jgi:hypothetical protein
VTSVVAAHPKTSPTAAASATCALAVVPDLPDVREAEPGETEPRNAEQRLLHVLSIVEHAVATRDRHHGPARDAHIDQALRDVRTALDSATHSGSWEARG